MGLHAYGHVNVPQRSNTRNYRVVTMNKMAVGNQGENLAAVFRVVLLFVSILKLVRHKTLLLKG